MISRLKGNLIKIDGQKILIEVNSIAYDVTVGKAVLTAIQNKLNAENSTILELVIYHYLTIDGNRGVPALIGFNDELERDFFEKIISVSGIGPKVAIKAFDRPIALIAQAIEEDNVNYLQQLEGIGRQKAKQLIASLQGKVGRFALLKGEEPPKTTDNKEIVNEAKQILQRLQYSAAEIQNMLKKAMDKNLKFDTVEKLLNEIYRQSK